ncbi:class I SAM-dependent methyltransferase [Sorangium sp. So ce834]|uniref:class I SAM-dependent methyltransferase n=1 Tax=Sorangium sp. So ce834 TaxID=3133321 RepID=UPI003F633462
MTSAGLYIEGGYLENNKTWHAEDSPWKAKQILRILEKNHIQPKVVYEVGCGAGEVLNQLHQRLPASVEFHGYDISPQAFQLAKAREKDRLTFHQEDLLEKDISCDVLMSIDVIEHVEDYYTFLRRLKSKADYKILHVPLDLSVQAVLRMKPILDVRRNVGHIHYFVKQTALASLQEAGYEIIDYFYTAGSVELPSKSFKAKLLRYPRRLLFALNEDFTARVLGGYSLLMLAR